MIRDIRLQHFRSYTDDAFEFDGGVNIIVGPNASGKTNLLEAILCNCRGSSYRVSDADLVQYGQSWSRLDMHKEGTLRTLKLESTGDRLKKTFRIDEREYSRLPYTKMLPVVLFEPNHLLLLSGAPELRREYVDSMLEQTIHGYGPLRRRYKRALAQRNALLKSIELHPEHLFAWNIRLSELGGQIAAHRLTLTERIGKSISQAYGSLSGRPDGVSIAYKSKCSAQSYGSSMLHRLELESQLDASRGFTATGPHRDDIAFFINEKPASLAASRGEARTLLLALKMLELEVVRDTTGSMPVLLLDDVFSELDGKRRHALTKALQGYQTFITTTDADVVIQHFTEECRIIPLAS